MSDETAQVLDAPDPDTAPTAANEPIQGQGPAERQPEAQEPAPELIEIDRGGKKYQIPKELNDELLMRADYTRKTQEIAETRRQAESEIAARRQEIEREREIVQASEELAAARVQLKDLRAVTPDQWQQYTQTNPAEAQAAFMRMQALIEKERGLTANIQQDQQRKAFETQQQAARRLEQAAAEVRSAIPDWSDAKDRELADYAQKSLGAPKEATGLPAWVIKAVHKAALYDKSIKSATATQSIPATATRTVSGGATTAIDSDKLPMDEWVKQRNKQLRGK